MFTKILSKGDILYSSLKLSMESEHPKPEHQRLSLGFRPRQSPTFHCTLYSFDDKIIITFKPRKEIRPTDNATIKAARGSANN